jgi:hypothetical protein
MALLPPFFLDTVVAIGVGDEKKRNWIATGFVYGQFVPAKSNQESRYYQLWLITNRHVLQDLRTVYVKFNSAADPHSKDYKIPLVARNGRPLWIGHPNSSIDVAAIWVNSRVLSEEQRKYSFFESDRHTMTTAQMRDLGVTEGDRVFVLGFPMGLVEAGRQYVICRAGAIARIRDFLEDKGTEFLVDATVFPGNSGGPVIICPSALAITGTKQIVKADLIGIVKSYVPYSDMAVSSQTRKPRIVFEENSGLTAVEPVDAILQTVKLAEKRLKGRIAHARHRAKKTASSQTADSTSGQATAPPVSPPADPPIQPETPVKLRGR